MSVAWSDKQRTLNYSSPTGKATVVLALTKETATRRTYRVRTNTFDSSPELKDEFNSLVRTLPTVLAGRTVKPARPTNTQSYAANTDVIEDVDCKKQDGKCVCKCTHGWNPFGAAFCLGFLAACPGDTNWINQTCSGSADSPACK